MSTIILSIICLALSATSCICYNQMSLPTLLAMFPYSAKMSDPRTMEKLTKFLVKNLEPEIQKENAIAIKKQNQQAERERAENLAYKKYFGGMGQATSIFRDFFPMRYK